MIQPSQAARTTLISWVLATPALLLIAFFYFEQGLIAAHNPQSTDFYKFYLSGERLRSGQSMYWRMPAHSHPGDPCALDSTTNPPPSSPTERLTLGGADTCLHPNLNLPIFALIAAPLSLLPYQEAWWTWSVVSMACAFFSLWAIFGVLHPKRPGARLWFPWACLALLCYYPFYCNFIYGQISTLLLLHMTLAWKAARQGKHLVSGIWLGIATSLKPFFGLFFIAFVAAKMAREAWGMVLAILVCTAASLAWPGPSAVQDYFTVAKEITWTSNSWNASLTGFFSRLLGGSENTPWINAPHVGQACIVVVSLIFCTTLWRIIRMNAAQENHLRVDAIFIAVPPTMLLLSPLGWLYYFPILCTSTVILWVSLDERIKHIHPRWILAALIALTCIPRALNPSSAMNSAVEWWGEGALYFYVLLILTVVAQFGAAPKPLEQK